MARTPPSRKAAAWTRGLPQSPEDYLDMLLKRWRWILAPWILGIGLSFVAVNVVTKQYRSSTVIMVESDEIPQNFIPGVANENARDRLRTLLEEVRSRARIEEIIDRFDPYPELTKASRAVIVEMIRDRTTVRDRGSDAFVIQYADTVPQRAQQMANRIASIFIEETFGDRERQAQGASEFIERQLEETRLELETVEDSLRAVKRRYNGMLPEQLPDNRETLRQLRQEKTFIEEEISVAKDRRRVLERQQAVQLEMLRSESQLLPVNPAGTTGAARRQQEIIELKARLTELRERYTEEHPEVVALSTQIANLEKKENVEGEGNPETGSESYDFELPSINRYTAETEAWLASIDNEIASLQAREGEIQNQIQDYQRRVEMVPTVEEELLTFERDYEMVRNYYNDLLRQKLQAGTTEDVEQRWREEQFRVLDLAQLPEKHFYPNSLTFLAMGSVIGLGVGVGLAFLVEILDHSIKDVNELEDLLPYPLLVIIPHISTKTRDVNGGRRRSLLPRRMKPGDVRVRRREL